MRRLTSKQKKLLTATLELYQPKSPGDNSIKSVDDLPDSVWQELEKINDTEILYQEVNRFIDDWRWSKI